MSEAMYIDDLVRVCGYFRTQPPANNGYACAHPKQETRQDGIGCCMPFSCPIATELHPEEDDEDQAVIDATAGRHVNASNDGWMLLFDDWEMALAHERPLW